MSSSVSSLYAPAERIASHPKNVWVEFTRLTRENQAVNLGQGFPDIAPESHIKAALIEAASSDNVALCQYTRSEGHPRLVNALAAMYTKLQGREINALTEILVTVGAYESLYCTFQAIINPGDEVILIEPFFDCYAPQVTSAGGKPVYIPLRPVSKLKEGATSSKDFLLDPEELESKFSSKTKAMVINTPNNPLGKVFSRSELEMIANLCIRHNILCISDEVYEWLVYSGADHIRIATLPGMWERTITIGSAGKTLSVTGWKDLGWSIAPAELIRNLQTVHANSSYTHVTPTQEAVAVCLEKEFPLIGSQDSYFTKLSSMVSSKRDKMAAMLREIGFKPIIPEGGYFMMADFSDINLGVDLDKYDSSDDPTDFKFARWLIKEKKIAVIPPSAFYSQEHKSFASSFVRFCFIKEDSTIEKAAEKLREWKKSLSK
ncbi:predicted protein [Nematostella vectensis]|uniref:Aminotransferase class I/classII large domain-containing protein n=1 Tax=Nematostella vectensis TaxID=45351 RepID=A7SQB8_NEMVE|nr:predicted protein [Nematostella vectensis]|eukprot:XP_001626201.1 predicted protein [Nematostella vectensis]